MPYVHEVKYREVFPNRHTLLIVIHVETATQAIRNVKIAQDAGADGVFLINHRIGYRDLIRCYKQVREVFNDLWIGINFLDLVEHEMFPLILLPPDCDGLWVDNADILINSWSSTERVNTLQVAERYNTAQRHFQPDALFFGGVAFKYQEPVDDPARAARQAKSYVDVITTSGKGTGVAADVQKIRSMKEAIGDHPLAIASGVTPENVAEYECADCFLVATGVSNSHTELNPRRVRKLAHAVESLH